MFPLITIIIPFYNEGQYLKGAIESTLQQAYPNIEIILVNDGSTDESLSIAALYHKNNNHIRIITTQHTGPGHARNTGIEAANGQYICFLDGDDMLEKDALYKLYQNLQQYDADIAIGRFHAIHDAITGASKKWPFDSLSGTEAALEMYRNQIPYVIWAKLYKTSVIQKIRFPDDVWFEDRIFLLQCFLAAKHVSFLEDIVVYYRRHSTSITRRLISEKRIADTMQVYQMELNVIGNHPRSKNLNEAIDRHFLNLLIENLILLRLDANKLNNKNEIENCLAENVQIFKKQLKVNSTKTAKRDKLDLILLELHKIVGWKLLYRMVPYWKKKQYRSVYKLRYDGNEA